MSYKVFASIVCGHKENFGEIEVMLALFVVSKQWKELSKLVHIYNPGTEKAKVGLAYSESLPHNTRKQTNHNQNSLSVA